MSHISKIDVRVTDLTCLADCCRALGLEMKRQSTFVCYPRYMGDTALPAGFGAEDWGKCEYAIAIPGAGPETYEVGVVPARDETGGWLLFYDDWQGGYGLREKIGEKGHKLLQGYVREKAVRELKKQGLHLVSEERLENGTLQIRLGG